MKHSRTAGTMVALTVLALTWAFAVSATAVSAQDVCSEPIVGLTDCVRDQDCIYLDAGVCCSCFSNGYELAINKNLRGAHKKRQDQCCESAGCLPAIVCQFEPTARCAAGTCTLGRCGDGVVDPAGEICDDGDESATCDDDCTPAECGDFNVNSAAGESCDDGNTADGDGCSAACVCDDTTDADVDGVGDGCDVCANGDDDARAKVSFKAVGTDEVAGDDEVKLKAEFTLGAGIAFADLDPSADGLSVLVRRFDGRPLVSLTLPAGAFDGTRGWAASKSGTSWRYKDKGAPAAANGVDSVSLKDRSSKTPGRVAIKLRGREGDYDVGPTDVPLKVAIVAGNAASACAEHEFDRPDCKVSGSGDGMRCR